MRHEYYAYIIHIPIFDVLNVDEKHFLINKQKVRINEEIK